MADATPQTNDSNSAGASSRWLTLANGITLARLACAPLSLVAIFAGYWLLAAGLFVFAVASDMLDGFVARRRGTASALGGLLDHTADAVYVAVTLWSIAYVEAQAGEDLVPGILPLFIVLAFLQYVLDSKSLAGKPLRGSWLGRCNGIAYFVFVGVVVGRHALGLDWLPEDLVHWLGLAIVVSTLASMLSRVSTFARKRSG